MNAPFSEGELDPILFDNGGIEVLTEKMLNNALQVEMIEHLGADRYEQSDDRSGYRHGTYERKLTARLGQLTLEVHRQSGVRSTAILLAVGTGEEGDQVILAFHPESLGRDQ